VAEHREAVRAAVKKAIRPHDRVTTPDGPGRVLAIDQGSTVVARKALPYVWAIVALDSGGRKPYPPEQIDRLIEKENEDG
jgi:hypothetical protein